MLIVKFWNPTNITLCVYYGFLFIYILQGKQSYLHQKCFKQIQNSPILMYGLRLAPYKGKLERAFKRYSWLYSLFICKKIQWHDRVNVCLSIHSQPGLRHLCLCPYWTHKSFETNDKYMFYFHKNGFPRNAGQHLVLKLVFVAVVTINIKINYSAHVHHTVMKILSTSAKVQCSHACSIVFEQLMSLTRLYQDLASC